jgi:hypothetical protein
MDERGSGLVWCGDRYYDYEEINLVYRNKLLVEYNVDIKTMVWKRRQRILHEVEVVAVNEAIHGFVKNQE